MAALLFILHAIFFGLGIALPLYVSAAPVPHLC